MALVYVHCPECQSIDVVQYGKQANGTQRYRCNNRDCPRTIFLLQYSDKGRLPAVKQQIVDMTLNGSGVRDIVRVLGVSSATVIEVLKKKEPAIKQVNERLLKSLDPAQLDIIIRQVEEAEVDEMWSFVGSKRQQRWLWHAIDHRTGRVLAYVCGPREDDVFVELKALLAPFGITPFYTDGWGAYRRHLDPAQHTVGRSSRQGCHLAGASPAMSVAQIRHVAIPHPEVGNPWGDAWCKRPGRPVCGLRWERSGGLASGGA